MRVSRSNYNFTHLSVKVQMVPIILALVLNLVTLSRTHRLMTLLPPPISPPDPPEEGPLSSGEIAWRNLKWGFATSAYQIEGGWNVTGKGQGIWDNFTHRVPSPIADGSNGDVACDSYHLYEQDVKLLTSVGAQIYRFSMSWSRILPTGLKDSFDPTGAGVTYYLNLLDALEKAGIEPIVTLHHFDHPQVLEDLGGFLNVSFVDRFRDYAEIAFSTFGHRVKKWITFNEPWVMCVHGYRTGKFAPGKVETDPKTGSLLCGHNLIKAHASAYRLYHRKFKKHGGVVGISLFAPWFMHTESRHYPIYIKSWDYPSIDSRIDATIAVEALEVVIGWFAQPLTRGTYPDSLKSIYDLEKVPTLTFSPKWIKMINGSLDFLGINHYTTFAVGPTSWSLDDQRTEFEPMRWVHVLFQKSGSSWLTTRPEGMRNILRWIHQKYSPPAIYITENGFSDPETEDADDLFRDFGRIDYLAKYIIEIQEAIRDDGINIQIYAVWSLLDNFEWISGYQERFGVFGIDFKSKNLTRTRKGSACGLDWFFNQGRFRSGVNQTAYCGNEWFQSWSREKLDLGWTEVLIHCIVWTVAIFMSSFCAFMVFKCYDNEVGCTC